MGVWLAPLTSRVVQGSVVFYEFHSGVLDGSLNLFFFFFLFFLGKRFIYLAALALGCSMRDLSLQHTGFS